MSPRLVPAARGGATGKALAVGAAPRAGGAEGVLRSCLSLNKAAIDKRVAFCLRYCLAQSRGQEADQCQPQMISVPN